MTRTGRSISFTLAALLAVSTALTACGDAAPAGSSDTTTAADTPAVETTAPAEYIPPDKDYNGEEFVFYTQTRTGYAITKTNPISVETENADVINDAVYKRTTMVEDLLNVKITALEAVDDNAQKFTTSVLAGDNTYQAGLIHLRAMKNVAGSSGLLADLRSIDGLDLGASWINQSINDEIRIGDAQYMAIGDLCYYSLVSSGCLYFNKSMLETYKLEDPYQLVRDGKWTIDKLTEMSAKCSADVNGDNVMNEKDRYGMSGSKTVMQQLLYSSGNRITQQNKSGDLELCLNNERTVKIVEKGLKLLSDFSVNAYPDNFKSVANGDVWINVLLPMFRSNQLMFNFNWLFYALELRDMEADFGILPMPKFDEAQDRYYSQLSDWWADLFCVPVTMENEELTADVLNAMGYYSKQYLYPEIVNRAVVDKVTRDDDSAEMMQIIADSIVFDMYYIYTFGNIMNAIDSGVPTGENLFASKYAEMEPAAKTAIADIWEKIKG
ncbi:MAG: hypothetical protein J6C52_11245 [Clostridia bacterium]|nr:hypothetical protein [Clostridia bacterium]